MKREASRLPADHRIRDVLNDQWERWPNPPEWIELLAGKIDAADTFEDVPKEARTLVRQSAIMAAAAKDPRLKKRTLTNLYNERPTWLRIAHETLDRAVVAAYAATDPAGAWSEDWAEVWTDTGGATASSRASSYRKKSRGRSKSAGESAAIESCAGEGR